jgi:hypothetical protein
MLKNLATVFISAGLVLVGAVAAITALPPAPHDCFAAIYRDPNLRVFILNKCDGSVRVLTMPEAPPAGVPNYSKPNI